MEPEEVEPAVDKTTVLRMEITLKGKQEGSERTPHRDRGHIAGQHHKMLKS